MLESQYATLAVGWDLSSSDDFLGTTKILTYDKPIKLILNAKDLKETTGKSPFDTLSTLYVLEFRYGLHFCLMPAQGDLLVIVSYFIFLVLILSEVTIIRMYHTSSV